MGILIQNQALPGYNGERPFDNKTVCTMEFDLHIGNLVRDISKKRGIGPTELGKRIDTSKQNVYGIFKRKTMDTGLLSHLCIALNYNFFASVIDEMKKHKEEGMPEIFGSSDNTELTESAVLKTENHHLRNEIGYLKEVNNLLKEKLAMHEPLGD